MVEMQSAAERLLRSLGRLEVNYLFGNTGTDAAPLIEAYAKCQNEGSHGLPVPILATHEQLALSMAHGYAMVSGKLPAAFVHVSVGTANTVCSIMNAAREGIPILLTAGRTPIYEDDRPGSRDMGIHWGQEMFDQASQLRELVKWDYELRSVTHVETVLQRAVSIAMSEPRGPVYLSLPREVLTETMPAGEDGKEVRLASALAPEPNGEGIKQAASLLGAAQRPLIIAGGTGRKPEAVPALVEFAERFRIPVVAHGSRYMSFPAGHDLHLGFDSADVIRESDVILVLDCDVPWIPKVASPRDGCKVIHVGCDPLFTRIPIRGFRCDLALTGEVEAVIRRLAQTMEKPGSLALREQWSAAKKAKLVNTRAAQLASAKTAHPIHPVWVSHCIEQIKDDAIVVNEYPLVLDLCEFRQPGSYFGSSSASGLGWGMGAALGAKLAEPERLVISTLGDGAYIFSNPIAAHYASHQHGLPILFVVFNNGMWDAVRRATLRVYPEGAAAASNNMVLASLDGLPAFEKVCEAAGGYGERVEHADDLPAALARALKVVKEEKRQALLNVICQPR